MHEKRTICTPWCALLLGLIWLGGCRQIPLAPIQPPDQPIQASPRDESPPSTVVAPSTTATRIEGAILDELPLSPTPPSRSIRSNQKSQQPMSSQQARWLSPSEYPKWLKDCFSPHQLDSPPHIHRTVMPDYPENLRNEGVPGRVTILFKISPQGKLAHYLVSPGAHPELVKASVQAMKHWKFGIANFEGQPASVCYIQRFRYQIEE